MMENYSIKEFRAKKFKMRHIIERYPDESGYA